MDRVLHQAMKRRKELIHKLRYLKANRGAKNGALHTYDELFDVLSKLTDLEAQALDAGLSVPCILRDD